MVTTSKNLVSRRELGVTLTGLLLSPVAAAADSAVLLKVEGAVKTTLALTAEDLAQMPPSTAQFVRGGATSSYEGVLLYDILMKAGLPFGHEMVGKPMASYLLASAHDGYKVVFALSEIDPAFVGARVLVASKRDGGALSATEGPLRMIAPQDKLHARSVRSLATIEFVRLQP